MHAVQTARSNSFKCRRDSNDMQDGKEEKCAKFSSDGTRKGNIEWSHHAGLMQGLLNYVKQHKQHNPVKIDRIAPEDQQHAIANRREEHRNTRHVVCLHERKMMNEDSRSNHKVRQSQHWCPHVHCRAHACAQHRLVVHDYFEQGVILRKYHNEQRIEHAKSKKEVQNMRRLVFLTLFWVFACLCIF